jgi:hypothetical protein
MLAGESKISVTFLPKSFPTTFREAATVLSNPA